MALMPFADDVVLLTHQDFDVFFALEWIIADCDEYKQLV